MPRRGKHEHSEEAREPYNGEAIMPEICRFYGIVIKVYFRDHPHRISTLSTESIAHCTA